MADKGNERKIVSSNEEAALLLIDAEYLIRTCVVHRLHQMVETALSGDECMQIGEIVTGLGIDSEERDWASNPVPTSEEYLKMTEKLLSLEPEKLRNLSVLLIRQGWLPDRGNFPEMRRPGELVN